MYQVQGTILAAFQKMKRKVSPEKEADTLRVQCHERNVVLDGRPPPINNSEKELTRKDTQPSRN